MIPEITQHEADLRELCNRFAVRRLELFGSGAAGALRPDSDLDFLVEFDSEGYVPGYADRYFGLLESLEALFGREIDLIVSSSIQNPYFRASIDRGKVLLYAA